MASSHFHILVFTAYAMESGVTAHVAALENMFPSGSSVHAADSSQWRLALAHARAITAELEGISEYVAVLGPTRSVTLISLLQNMAYLDPDSGGETDISSWCERQWATILQSFPQNVLALQGKRRTGFAWRLC